MNEKVKEEIKKVSQEEFYKGLEIEIKRLGDWFRRTDSPMDALDSFIYGIVTEMYSSHYTMIGVLEEVKLRWRNRSIEVLEEKEKDE